MGWEEASLAASTGAGVAVGGGSVAVAGAGVAAGGAGVAVGGAAGIGVGADDILTTPDLAAEMAALIPGARLRHFADAAHLPTMETPEAVNAAMAAWLVA